MTVLTTSAAYGGPGWPQRTASLAEEIGTLWSRCGIANEWARLEAALLHRPGPELASVGDPDASLMLDAPDPERAARQHDALAEAYRVNGVGVCFVEPSVTPSPNQMFIADLMLMTPAGAILGRPASTVRAGEERWVARRLADLGIPILRSVGGTGTFEGSDAAWIDPETVLLARGLRTNAEGAAQVAATLGELGVDTIQVDMPHGAMHLMGAIRIVDRDLVFVRAERTPWTGLHALKDRGFEVRFFPDEGEIRSGFAHNFVTLGPRKILMPAGNSVSQAQYKDVGITCVTVELDEIAKAAGSIGCLTGVLARERVASD